MLKDLQQKVNHLSVCLSRKISLPDAGLGQRRTEIVSQKDYKYIL